ncbi:MAG: 2-dehydropantoate 2-reductase [Oscillospiraceae bacterium]|nr:2-dehydropantoate 2-reductase [Oscillospiraceae bacterium]
MKYLIIGAGGTGGCISAYLSAAGKDVTVIARGKHLRAIQKNGLTIKNVWSGTRTSYKIKCVDMEHYHDCPDVIFVCVKGYCLPQAIEFIRRTAHKNTIIIPILNIYTTGENMRSELPGFFVTDGCIYISANINSPGVIFMHGEIFRIVFGTTFTHDKETVLKEISDDLRNSNIDCIISQNIKKDALLKFSYVSAMAACGLYYDSEAGPMQQQGQIRDTFIALCREINQLAEAMGIFYDFDLAENNLAVLDRLSPTASTSMQRDIAKGKRSEIDGLIFEVVRLSEKYNVQVPVYKMISHKFQ